MATANEVIKQGYLFKQGKIRVWCSRRAHAWNRIMNLYIEYCILSVIPKKGGSYRSWKKRHFVLKGSTLSYYNAPNERPKGEIDLKTGRGVRPKSKCTLEWPSAAKANLCFGVATDSRTYYVYGTDKTDVA